MDGIKKRKTEYQNRTHSRPPIRTVDSESTIPNDVSANGSTQPEVSNNVPPIKHKKKRLFKRDKKNTPKIIVQKDGLLVWRTPKWATRFLLFCQRHRVVTKTITYSIVIALFIFIIYGAFEQQLKDVQYKISPKAEALLVEKNPQFGKKLKLDNENRLYSYNQDYDPQKVNVADEPYTPKFTAKFNEDPKKGTTIDDPEYKIGFTLKPKFRLKEPQKDENRLVYPLAGKKGAKIITLRSIGYKEDIVLEQSYGDKLDFSYDLELPDSLEARLEKDGSLAIYGPDNTVLMGSVSTGSDEDAKLLEKARKNSEKNTLMFKMPAPFIKQQGSKAPVRTTKFELNGKTLTIKSEGLEKLRYPISIDPTVYIETAAKLMRGNNETNTDFDVDNELIQKSQLTGARIDGWESNMNFNDGTWMHSTAASGGYVYRTGGRVDPTKPQIVGQQETYQNSNSSTFTMDMPSTRPAGDLYIALMCYDGEQGDGSGGSTAGNTISTPSGWTQYANRNGHAAYYKVGTDAGGGNEAASYAFTGDSEEWGGVIIRVTGFNSSDPISGTPGVGHNNSNAVPIFPATTPDSDSTLVIRGTGVDADEPSTTAWVPSGHTKIASGSSTGSNDCAFAAASLDTPPASGVSSGTATLADASLTDVYGASSIAINPATVTAGLVDTVQWAKFNSTTKEIESPNPGTGACSEWCSNSVYDLPENRAAHASVAYNGYLYVIGGSDGTNNESTIFISKLGANGEPQLWHPSGGTPAYWYTDSLMSSTARSWLGAVAYNGRLYISGGGTNASGGGTTDVFSAAINPNGTLTDWDTTSSLPATRFLHTMLVYNDTFYVIGGSSTLTLASTVYYAKINDATQGTLQAWQSTTSFTTARANWGGSMATIQGGYIYLAGGCTAWSGITCGTVASDVQLGSINADGTISEWNTITNLQNQRVGHSLLSWQGGLYRLGGCTQVNTTTGACINALADVDYGVVNEDGDASLTGSSVPNGTSPCTSGGGWIGCDLTAGNVLNQAAVVGGHLYTMGGCTNNGCTTVSTVASYQAIRSDGRLTRPASCDGTFSGSYCIETDALPIAMAAGATTVYDGRIFIVGGFGATNSNKRVYYSKTQQGGGLGTWSFDDLTSIGATDVHYAYAFTRANPGTAATNPGRLFILGGCTATDGAVGCSNYTQNVYKCSISTAGAVSSCSTSGQLQIGTVTGASGSGLGAMAGAEYANYIYLMGGLAPGITDLTTVRYAKIDSSNNIVTVSSGWVEGANQTEIGRRRGAGFGYNGHLYITGGFDATEGVINNIEFAKLNVSDGSWEAFQTSAVKIQQRWGLTVQVSNSYAYVIGGCIEGAAPSSCSNRTSTVETFQIYNNDSGAVQAYTATSDQTYGTDNNRKGHGAAVLNGYMYVAGGCTVVGLFACDTETNSVVYAPISAADGTVGTWSNVTSSLPQARAFGALMEAGGTLYYVGGHDGSLTYRDTVYYATPGGSGDITSWSTASNVLPAARVYFGSAVWNDRMYVVGGDSASGTGTQTIYRSPQQSSGGNITSAWTSDGDQFSVARWANSAVAYANNLYVMGGQTTAGDLLADVQFTKINSDGSLEPWQDTTSLPWKIRGATATVFNGYIYLVGGGTGTSQCTPRTLIAPISANTTIATGNNPTGVGQWFETNANYTGDRDFAAVVQTGGKLFVMGGGCDGGTNPLSSNRHWYSTLKTQPQVAKYSRMIDTDTDVFPNSWLLNGVDNSIGARWRAKYRSMNDIDGVATDCGTADMSTWGQETDYGEVTLGDVATYTPKDGSGTNINCARYYYFYIEIDSSYSFGYPEDVERGPTIADLSLFFTSDPSKRLRHGKTFTGGEQQPLDTPCRQTNDAQCPLP